jgi:hypothetical protein
VTIPDNFGLSPRVLAQFQDIWRISEPTLANTPQVRDFIANMRPLVELIAQRQHPSINDLAMRVTLPPGTRQAMDDIANRFLEQHQFSAVALAVREPAVEQGLIDLLPRTPEETEQVERAIIEVRADPDLSEKLRNVVAQINWSGVARKLSPWGLLYLAYHLLMEVANLPVSENLSAAQTAALQNKFAVVAIVVSIGLYIISTRND